MNRVLKMACLVGVLASAGAHAELYKWVGPDGKVSYSDTPPPSVAKQVEAKPIATVGGAGGVELPYELAQAARNNPVVLYTTSSCGPCDDARRLLTERGIPYTEKSVNTGQDTAEFRKRTGAEARFPYLTIGRNAQRGLDTAAWQGALSAAGYPERSILPKPYRNPVAEALVPPKAEEPVKPVKRAAATTPVEPAATGELPPATGNAPPGFRF